MLHTHSQNTGTTNTCLTSFSKFLYYNENNHVFNNHTQEFTKTKSLNIIEPIPPRAHPKWLFTAIKQNA